MRTNRLCLECLCPLLFTISARANPQSFSIRIGNLENDDTFTPFFQDTLAPSTSSFSNLAPPSPNPSPSFSPSSSSSAASSSASSSSASFSSSPFSSFPFSSFPQSQSSELQNSNPSRNTNRFSESATLPPPLPRSAPAPTNNRNVEQSFEATTESLEAALKRNQQFRQQWEDAVANHQRIVDEHTKTLQDLNSTTVRHQDTVAEQQQAPPQHQRQQQQQEKVDIAERPLLRLQELINNNNPQQQQQTKQQQQNKKQPQESPLNKIQKPVLSSASNNVAGRRDPLKKAIKTNRKAQLKTQVSDDFIDLDGHGRLLAELQASLGIVEDLANDVLFRN